MPNTAPTADCNCKCSPLEEVCAGVTLRFTDNDPGEFEWEDEGLFAVRDEKLYFYGEPVGRRLWQPNYTVSNKLTVRVESKISEGDNAGGVVYKQPNGNYITWGVEGGSWILTYPGGSENAGSAGTSGRVAKLRMVLNEDNTTRILAKGGGYEVEITNAAFQLASQEQQKNLGVYAPGASNCGIGLGCDIGDCAEEFPTLFDYFAYFQDADDTFEEAYAGAGKFYLEGQYGNYLRFESDRRAWNFQTGAEDEALPAWYFNIDLDNCDLSALGGMWVALSGTVNYFDYPAHTALSCTGFYWVWSEPTTSPGDPDFRGLVVGEIVSPSGDCIWFDDVLLAVCEPPCGSGNIIHFTSDYTNDEVPVSDTSGWTLSGGQLVGPGAQGQRLLWTEDVQLRSENLIVEVSAYCGATGSGLPGGVCIEYLGGEYISIYLEQEEETVAVILAYLDKVIQVGTWSGEDTTLSLAMKAKDCGVEIRWQYEDTNGKRLVRLIELDPEKTQYKVGVVSGSNGGVLTDSCFGESNDLDNVTSFDAVGDYEPPAEGCGGNCGTIAATSLVTATGAILCMGVPIAPTGFDSSKTYFIGPVPLKTSTALGLDEYFAGRKLLVYCDSGTFRAALLSTDNCIDSYDATVMSWDGTTGRLAISVPFDPYCDCSGPTTGGFYVDITAVKAGGGGGNSNFFDDVTFYACGSVPERACIIVSKCEDKQVSYPKFITVTDPVGVGEPLELNFEYANGCGADYKLENIFGGVHWEWRFSIGFDGTVEPVTWTQQLSFYIGGALHESWQSEGEGNSFVGGILTEIYPNPGMSTAEVQ